MVNAIFWFVIGLLVGWNLLKQPVWVKASIDKVVGWVKGLFGGDK